MSKPVVLILGSGPRVGAAVAQQFADDGYQVAVTSRKGTNSKTADGLFSVQGDLADSNSVPSIFDRVQQEFRSYPAIIIYNAAALTPPPEQGSIFSISGDSVAKDLVINTVSAYVAAQEAVKGWQTLPAGAKKLFVFTGNMQNVTILPVPMMFTLGIGKAASAQWIGVADTTASKGERFIYADERQEDGKMKGLNLDGAAHAEFYSSLAKDSSEVPWHATFVKGKGYTKF